MTNEQKNRQQIAEPAGFTPGPWIVKKNRAVYAKRYKKLPKDRVYGYGLADNEGFICVLEDEEYHVYADKQECKANASLIAAAPKMYAALCILHDALLDTGMFPDAVAAIEDVIKEARGER